MGEEVIGKVTDYFAKIGVAAIFQPGTAMDSIVQFIRANVKPRGVPAAG